VGEKGAGLRAQVRGAQQGPGDGVLGVKAAGGEQTEHNRAVQEWDRQDTRVLNGASKKPC
jgi:hypothetical protein